MSVYEKIGGGILVVLVIFVILNIFADFTWTDPDEYCFKYNILQSTPINKGNNPLLKNGPHMVGGFNGNFFTVTQNSLHVDFKNARLSKIMELKGFATEELAAKYRPNSDEMEKLDGLYDMAPTFNSEEGSRMSISTSISGRVFNPWLFYKHYKDPQYSYNKQASGKVSSHLRVYEALYQANQYVDVRMTEICQDIGARQIQMQQESLKETLLADVQIYMRQFGFEIDNLMFTDKFVYLDGSEVLKARQELGSVNSEEILKQNELKVAQELKTNAINEARRQADKIISAAKREAERQLSEANALGKLLLTSIDRLGVEAAVDLYRTKLVAPLLKDGKVSELNLDDQSFIGKAIN